MSQTRSSGRRKAVEPVVRIDSEVTRCVRQHARSHPKTEVCGVLIGENDGGVIEVRASIEGINAAQAGTHVTFTQDAWEGIYRIKDELYPEERIVGWYHSHPGFGVFLSEHDLFIQENFFSSPGQIAWVYDPHTDEEGCFGWVDGAVHRISSLSFTDNNGDGSERTPKRTESSLPDEEEVEAVRLTASRGEAPPRWAQWTMTLLSHLAVLAFGFMVASFVYPMVILPGIDPASGELVLHGGHILVNPFQDKFPIPFDLPIPQGSQSNPLLPGAAPATSSPPANGQPASPQPSQSPAQPQSAAPPPSTKPAPSGGHP